MNDIKKMILTKNIRDKDYIIHPQTSTDMVVDPKTGKPLTLILSEIPGAADYIQEVKVLRNTSTEYILQFVKNDGTSITTPNLKSTVSGGGGEGGGTGADGFSPIITPNSSNTATNYRLDITTADGTITTPNLIGIQGVSPTISPNASNTSKVYKLDITTADGTITTPNLKGEPGEGGGTGGYDGAPETVLYTNKSVDGDNLKEVLDTFFDSYYYVAPSVTSFTANPGTTVYELGQTVTKITFSWTFNKNSVRQTLTECTIEPTDRTAVWNGSVSSNKKFTIEFWDSKNKNAWRDFTINFQNKKYWGAKTIPSNIDSEFILGLQNSQLTANRNGNVTSAPGAGEYFWFCIPTSFGTPTFTIGGFAGGFAKVSTLQFTNASGHTSSYDVYRSDNPSLGETTAVVS